MLRDRSNLAIGVILPIVLILIFGYGLSLDIPQHAPGDRSRGQLAGREGRGCESWRARAYFSTVLVASIREAEDLMRQRTVRRHPAHPGGFLATPGAGGRGASSYSCTVPTRTARPHSGAT
ncbi:hypothetical protein ACPA9J_27225 [Pseudomonas aeruginosa]